MEEYERLRQRFVRGEIGVDEYERRLKALHRHLSQEDLDRIATARARRGEGAFVVTSNKGAGSPTQAIPPLPARRRRVSRYVPVAGGCLMIFAALCAVTSVIGGMIAAFDGDGHDYITNNVTEDFTVSARPTLRIHNAEGDVRIVPGELRQVNVQADTELSREPGPGTDGAFGTFSAEQDGNTINIDAGGDGGPFWFSRRDGSTDLVVAVPPESSLDLELNNGDVEIEGITGEIRTDVADGNVRLNVATLSDDSAVEVDTGDVDITGNVAPDTELDITVENGDIRLAIPRNSDTHLEASTDEGAISVAELPIGVTREDTGATASGSLTSEPSGRIEVEVENGNISLSARN